MAEHTPGPWKVDEHGYMGAVYVRRMSGSLIAETPYLVDRDNLANAHLIAAAPDLLAVAKAYEEWEADLLLNADWSDSMPRMTQAQFDRLSEIQKMRNAAIAKMKGE